METHKISAKAILADIKAGMNNTALMQKYGLSDKGLQSVFKRLVDGGVLKQEELCKPQNNVEVVSQSALENQEEPVPTRQEPILPHETSPPQMAKTGASEFIGAEVKGLWQKYNVPIVVGGIVIIGACILSREISLNTLTLALGTAASIIVLILAARMSQPRDTPKALEMPALPEEFLELNPSLRRAALDLAWKPAWQKAITEMVSGGTKGSSTNVAYFFGFAFILTGLALNFVLLAVAITPDSKKPAFQSAVSKSQELPEQAKREPENEQEGDVANLVRADTREMRLRLFEAQFGSESSSGLPVLSLHAALEKVMPDVSEETRIKIFNNWKDLGLWPPLEQEIRGASIVRRIDEIAPEEVPRRGTIDEGKFDEMNKSLQTTTEPESKTLLVLSLLGSLLFSYYLGLVCLSAGPDLKRRQLEEETKKRNRVLLETRLRELAIKYVGQNYWRWIEAMSRETEHRAQGHAGASPDATFRLVSPELALKESGMPHKTFHITYIFSNGYISVVSNISWDIYSTINSLVERDEPAYMISAESAYRSEEFHYQDVVEVTYKPRPEPEISVAGHSLNEVKKKLRLVREPEVTETDPSAEGNLMLSLVNGEKKEYPSVKDAATSFLVVAREKVRLAKKKVNP